MDLNNEIANVYTCVTLQVNDGTGNVHHQTIPDAAEAEQQAEARKKAACTDAVHLTLVWWCTLPVCIMLGVVPHG